MTAQTLDQTATATTAFVFSCNQCGQCCTSVSIPIEPAKAKVLQQLDWVKERLRLYGLDFKPLPNAKYDARWQVPLTPDRRCVFLGDANECLVHHLAGPELKPDECHRYPFSSGVRYPASLESQPQKNQPPLSYDVTASCQSVAEGLANGVVHWLPSSPLPQHPSGDDTLPDFWPVTHSKNLPWEDREVWLQFLSPMITDSAVTAWELLQAAATIFQKESSKPFLTHAFRERLWLLLCLRKPYSLWSVATLLLGKGYVDEKVLGPSALTISSVFVMPVDDTSTALKAFVVSILSRRLPYASGMDARGLWWLALSGWVLVRFYARALSFLEPHAKAQAGDIDESLVVVAIRLVERYYTGHQPRFVAWVHRRSRQSWLLSPLLKVFSS